MQLPENKPRDRRHEQTHMAAGSSGEKESEKNVKQFRKEAAAKEEVWRIAEKNGDSTIPNQALQKVEYKIEAIPTSRCLRNDSRVDDR